MAWWVPDKIEPASRSGIDMRAGTLSRDADLTDHCAEKPKPRGTRPILAVYRAKIKNRESTGSASQVRARRATFLPNCRDGAVFARLTKTEPILVEVVMPKRQKQFLDEAYGVEDAQSTHRLYEDWAATYDAETKANGYVTPTRCAEALSRFVSDKSAPLLDIGCGTGLSGEAFREFGFSTIDGTDFSQPMLDYAASKKGVYRRLIVSDLNNPLPGSPGEYANMSAVGVFSPGHGPPELIDTVVERLPQGGCFVFSLNDHALENPAYEARVSAIDKAGIAENLFWEYGDHLPGRKLKAVVCVLRKF
jgi:SAM-dependent methyltransferase